MFTNYVCILRIAGFSHCGLLHRSICSIFKSSKRANAQIEIQKFRPNHSAFNHTTSEPKDRNIKMAYATSNAHIAHSPLAERFATVISKFFTNFALSVAEGRYMSELSNLSNRELADIGIKRTDIPKVAREAARGTRT
jgi:uncharacterized protein YjiS (DUF1127 family)